MKCRQEVITLTTVLISKYGLGKKKTISDHFFVHFFGRKFSTFSRMSNLVKLSCGLAYTFSKRNYKPTYYITVTTLSIFTSKTIAFVIQTRQSLKVIVKRTSLLLILQKHTLKIRKPLLVIVKCTSLSLITKKYKLKLGSHCQSQPNILAFTYYKKYKLKTRQSL